MIKTFHQEPEIVQWVGYQLFILGSQHPQTKPPLSTVLGLGRWDTLGFVTLVPGTGKDCLKGIMHRVIENTQPYFGLQMHAIILSAHTHPTPPLTHTISSTQYIFQLETVSIGHAWESAWTRHLLKLTGRWAESKLANAQWVTVTQAVWEPWKVILKGLICHWLLTSIHLQF